MSKAKGVNVDLVREKYKELNVDDQRKILNEMLLDNKGNMVYSESAMFGIFSDRLRYKFPKDRKKDREEAEELYSSNPIAKWYVNLVTSFVIGEGPTLSFGNDKFIKALLDRFNLINGMSGDKEYIARALRKFYRADLLHGEGFYRLWICPEDNWKPGAKKGDIILRRLATNVVDVSFNPSDPEEIFYYRIQWYDQSTSQFVEEQVPPLDRFLAQDSIDGPDISFSEQNKRRYIKVKDSCIIHFKMNDLPNSIHGVSDLRVLFEWLEMYLEHLRNGVLQGKLRGGGAYDIEIDEADQTKFDAIAANYKTWSIGENFVHNDKVKVNVKEFQSPLDGFEDIRRAVLLVIITGASLSEHYSGDSQSGSRAQGQSMELPQMKSLEDRQSDWGWVVYTIYKTALKIMLKFGLPSGLTLDTGVKSKKLLEKIDDPETFSVRLPSISLRDRQRVIENLVEECDMGVISLQTASKELGRDFDVEQELINAYEKKYGGFTPLLKTNILTPTDKLTPPSGGIAPNQPIQASGGIAPNKPVRRKGFPAKKGLVTKKQKSTKDQLPKPQDGSAEPMDRRHSKKN